MILPSKHLSRDRALLTVGGRILTFLALPKTVSALWEELNKPEENLPGTPPRRITYDWFLLTLDLLYALGAIDLDCGLVARRIA
ncbi:hypothetical protein FNU76_11380 [Chitinimonas arctica]|uniref:Uncharacterized protein n=1 Tax=Chitinimonas arctica TaxID=2594795 RepID=A0A516SFH8_9NEIS|nr:ABC-three component system middle component 6 [Chitinimonas arctica]QDQ26914.1 hypothetical protein FNU76_11380 [Chitinimonas arctica]